MKSKTTCCPPCLLQAKLHAFTPDSSMFAPSSTERTGDWGCSQSIAASLCRSFLLTPLPCSSMGCPQATVVWISAPVRAFCGLQGNPCSAWSTSSPSSFSDLVVCRTVSHFFSLFFCLSGGFCPFLNRLSPRCHQPG